MDYSIQCHLQKGETHQIAWLPEDDAIKGRWVALKMNDEWSDGWQITEVGARTETQRVTDQMTRVRSMKKNLLGRED